MGEGWLSDKWEDNGGHGAFKFLVNFASMKGYAGAVKSVLVDRLVKKYRIYD